MVAGVFETCSSLKLVSLAKTGVVNAVDTIPIGMRYKAITNKKGFRRLVFMIFSIKCDQSAEVCYFSNMLAFLFVSTVWSYLVLVFSFKTFQ